MTTIVYWFIDDLWKSSGYADLGTPSGPGLGTGSLGTTPLGS